MQNLQSLDNWLSGLWYTGGGEDELQFNIAVLQLIRSNPGVILNSAEIRDYILSKQDGTHEEESDFWNEANNKAYLITNISEFVKINKI